MAAAGVEADEQEEAGMNRSQKAPASNVAQEPELTASDRFDLERNAVDPRARALFWRCYSAAITVCIAVGIIAALFWM